MYKRILVPVSPGFGPEAEEAIALARSLIDDVGHIDVLTVFPTLPGQRSAGVLKSDRAHSSDEIKEQVKSGLKLDSERFHTRDGHATREILDFASQREHECIVIASHTPGWRHALLGSTASGVVRHARCSVFVVRSNARPQVLR